MSESVEKIAKFLAKLDAQNFGPKDSVVVSAINNPVGAVKKGVGFLSDQIKTINSPVMPSYKKAEAALNLAEIAQTGAFPMAPSSKGGTLGSITTYHGSPHKFDQFDMSKIGTGEGAQAYGHGLYFAESPEVAKTYLNEGINAARNGYIDELPNAIQTSIYNAFQMPKGIQRNSKIEKLKADYPELSSVIDKAISENQGNLYKTSLEWPDAAREAADPLGPHHFLDWDKPLSEQPESVKVAWANLFGDIPEPKGPIGRTLKGLMAEDDLKTQGIPGIRYLDGGSRGAGEGSYNYVVFDQDIPKIVERNGVAFPIHSEPK